MTPTGTAPGLAWDRPRRVVRSGACRGPIQQSGTSPPPPELCRHCGPGGSRRDSTSGQPRPPQSRDAVAGAQRRVGGPRGVAETEGARRGTKSQPKEPPPGSGWHLGTPHALLSALLSHRVEPRQGTARSCRGRSHTPGPTTSPATRPRTSPWAPPRISQSPGSPRRRRLPRGWAASGVCVHRLGSAAETSQ